MFANLLPAKMSISLLLSLTGALGLAGCAAAPIAPHTGPGSTVIEIEDYPGAHVHGMAAMGGGRIILATHEGLFDVSASPASRIGPHVDWMGFSRGVDGFYASGHPGPGSDLENPVGLMRSTNHGETWETLSRAGTSDFHALTVSKNAVIGFDGMLRSTADGRNWENRDPRIRPATLAADPHGSIVLAATEQGIWRSTDDGKTFAEPDPGAPVLQYIALAGQRAVGFTPDNVAWTSLDGGVSWAEGASTTGMVHAVALGADGKDIWVSSSAGVEHASDAAEGFTVRLAPGR